jgi:chitinase
MIDAADGYCEDYIAGHIISQDWNPGIVETTYTRVDSEVTGVKILVFVEATKECEWKVDVGVCKNVMRKMIDACDTNGENRKQGGRVVGDCLTWRLDPNSEL